MTRRRMMLAGLNAGLVQSLDAFAPRRRLLREIRAAWGKAGDKDGWLAERYFELTRGADHRVHVDDRTWSDLEFPRIFKILDSTTTRLGSQHLFRQLRTFPGDAQHTHDVQQACEVLRSDQQLRESIQLALATLSTDSAATIIENILQLRSQDWGHPRLALAWSVVCIGLIAAIAASLIPWITVIALLAVNVSVLARTGPRRYGLTQTFSAMHRMCGAAMHLGTLRAAKPFAQLEALAAHRATSSRVRHALRVPGLPGRLPLGLGNWLNLLCLAEWAASLYTIDRVSRLRGDLQTIYDLVGALDAAVAVASYLEWAPTWCRAVEGPGRLIDIKGGRHPLLEHPVPNDLCIRNRSALVSGSNMAGKTTFIKMIGINVILGRTLGFCLAESAVVPAAPVMACIRSQQSVESGRSRYFDEIEAILSFLRSAALAPLVVLDEPFSGTNTTERIAAAKAVLAALSGHSIVLATTHDVELQTLLQDQFDLFHFTERPDLENFFDYHLHAGACTEGNALRLLARVGFPPEIVAEAVAYVAARSDSSATLHAHDGDSPMCTGP